MTVKELIEKLKEMPQDARVFIFSMDTYGEYHAEIKDVDHEGLFENTWFPKDVKPVKTGVVLS